VHQSRVFKISLFADLVEALKPQAEFPGLIPGRVLGNIQVPSVHTQ
jgi:hypothetical protein